MNIILFDGICNLCSGVVLFLIKRDKKSLFRFASIQSETGQSLIKQYAAEGEPNSTIFYIRDKECFQKSAAILHILKDIGKGWRCFYPLILIPSCIRDAVYMLISRNRYKWFGKKQTCLIPTPEIKGRFLD